MLQTVTLLVFWLAKMVIHLIFVLNLHRSTFRALYLYVHPDIAWCFPLQKSGEVWQKLASYKTTAE